MKSLNNIEITSCEIEDHEYKINLAYSHLDNIVSNALLDLIYHAIVDNQLQDMIDLNLIFELIMILIKKLQVQKSIIKMTLIHSSMIILKQF